jgi:hypothetical protein
VLLWRRVSALLDWGTKTSGDFLPKLYVNDGLDVRLLVSFECDSSSEWQVRKRKRKRKKKG